MQRDLFSVVEACLNDNTTRLIGDGNLYLCWCRFKGGSTDPHSKLRVRVLASFED